MSDTFSYIFKSLRKTWKDKNLLDKLTIPEDHKYYDRVRSVNVQIKIFEEYLSDYIGPDKSILDVSTGNGAFLEVARWLGNTIQGTDNPNKQYKAFHDSQKVPVDYFDGASKKYPYEDNSFDLVSCVGAFTFYEPVTCWTNTLSEFFRISKSTVFLRVNSGDTFDNYRNLIDQVALPKGWNLTLQSRTTYRWDYN